jgi:D-alanyl-D-alanine dipeptidase
MPILRSKRDYMDVSKIPGVLVKLKYASRDNFMKENLYGRFKTCFLHETAALKLKNAVAYLQASNPNFHLLVYDGLRPRSVQRKMWARVEGTPFQKYVANPDEGSMHNFGLALDLSVQDPSGKVLDMGADYDDFRSISEPRYEKKFLKTGNLTKNHLKNRLILRNAMQRATFIQHPYEWWHYDAMPLREAKKGYSMVE